MTCPVCKRDLAPTLSICLTCGAMMNDTVREELQSKVAVSVSGGLSAKILPKAPGSAAFNPSPAVRPKAPQPRAAEIVKPAPSVRIETSDLRIKKTSPTLVGFQSKNAALPDWRLQLQNSIRQRTGTAPRKAADEEASVPAQLVTRGANALKAEPEHEQIPAEIQNPRVANALRRIEESRRAFRPAEKAAPSGTADPSPPASRNYPFNVVSRTADAVADPKPAAKAVAVKTPKPKLVSSLRIEKRGLDTNKLPPLPKQTRTAADLDVSISVPMTAETKKTIEPHQAAPAPDETIVSTAAIQPDESATVVTEEQDDLAPIAMRFNAGLFDTIISVFASLILMSPFMIAGGSWISISGALAFGAATSIVMFLYLTISIGFYGRTFGMRLFSLELIDIDDNEYPSLYQAAVNSSVFSLSIACAGLGFVPMLMNDERRAAHDLLSGTILVREY